MERCVLATTIPSLGSSAWVVTVVISTVFCVISICVLSTFQGILMNKKRQSEGKAMDRLPQASLASTDWERTLKSSRSILKTLSLKVSRKSVLNWLLFSCSSLLTVQNRFLEKKKTLHQPSKQKAFLLLITLRYLVQYIGWYCQNLYIGSSYWDYSDLSFIVKRMTSPYLFWGSWKRSQKLLVLQVLSRLMSRKSNDEGGIFS